MIRRLNPLYALLPLALFLGACTTDDDESVEPVTDPSPGFVATFQPASAQVPFPNDIFFSGTADGTLNIPATGDASLAALNLLDGYSTNAAIYAETTDVIAEESVIYGATVFLVNTTNPLAPVAAQASVADYQNGSTVIEIQPLAPLDAGTTYAAFLTKNIVSTTGDNLSTDADFQALVDLYADETPFDTDLGDATTTALYGAIAPLLQLADGAGIGSSNIAVAWSFKTQTIGASLAAIEAGATAQSAGFVPVPKNGVNYDDGIATTADMDARLAGHADVYVGVIEMPYYSSVESPLTGYWTPAAAPCQAVVDAVDALTEQPESTTGACPTPAVNATIKVPVLLTVPNAASASGGAIAGVTIFQHGITGDRTNMLGIADALADAGQAVVAIDLPLHGLTDNTNPLYASDASPLYGATGMTDITEATFDLDVDGEAGNDPSGEYFINLESLPTARDNLRQASSNLIYLTKSIPEFDYNIALSPALAGADFGGLPISFVGQSLGSMTGVPYLAVNDNDTCGATVGCPALLSVPGGTVAALLAQSPTFGPVVEEGLAENGIIAGTRMFAEFLRNAQTVVDSGDPINYAADAALAHPIVVQEVIGGASSAADQVIPNFATDALVDAMGLDQLGPAFYNDTAGVSGVVKFVAGNHSSLLDPSASLEVTTEMQVEAASFIGSQGTQLAVGVSAVGGQPQVIDSP
ncbi:MAG TPA: hypothetical protein VF275_08680 [Gammaproteobacteria bacterium]